MTLLPHKKIRTVDYTFEDKSGRAIKFELHEDCEGPNRGFTVDCLKAYYDDETVGYLRTIYQDETKLDEFFPSGILNFIDQSGKSIFDGLQGHGEQSTDIRTADAELLTKTAHRLVLSQLAINKPSARFETYEDFQNWFKDEEVSSRSLQIQRTHYNKMLERVNQHTVDYIETIPDLSKTNGILNDNSGLGIATALYKVMAKELAQKGHLLHSGFHQKPAAEAIWNKFREEGITQDSAVFTLQYATETEPAIMRPFINPDAYELNNSRTFSF